MPLELNREVEKQIRGYFDRRGIVMKENNLRQAMVPHGAEVLRNEWGFNGFVLTDYEVGAGKGSYMDTLQTLAAGGDAKLKTVGMDALFGFNISKYPQYQQFGRDAAHHILYTVVNSAAMNGFVHGVEFVNGFAYYKLILIGWDVLALGGMILMGFAMRKRLRKPAAATETP